MTYQAPAPTRPRAAVVVLGVLVVLLVGASVLMGVRYAEVVDDRDRQVAHLEEADRELTGAQERLADTRGQVDEVLGRISDLEARNTELRGCAEPARDSIIAARDGDDAALGPAVDRASDNC
ncbi:hypothetical protein [Saccharothrix syringae]|uniref:DUF2746 domain-containing protein n=1 Tax=Saccharothrix syringae TaxID=103733 RepID=A0A5Q0H8X3_SACSY|nr:hypothetical protein [Saccharothrix syringae]QFZ22375.1 hypothetical protein EKG83_37575 [Saccharothrix syringae]